MQFEFATAGRILFGPDSLEKVPSIAAGMGLRALLVTGGSGERAKPLQKQLIQRGMDVASFQVRAEPTVEVAQQGVKLARQAESQVVIGMGGGSVLDTAKVIAALLTNGGELLDYLEVVGRGAPLTHTSAPCIAIPTTAGTGAEVTRNAVLGVPEQHVKVSMRSHFMLPAVAVVDPVLTYSLPPSLTASTGLDALTQLIEAFVSNQASPFTDGICREGLARAARSLHRAHEDGGDRAAREGMALASLFGGLALANARLGAVHGLAGPLGGMYPVPHGVVCGRLLPWVMEVNLRALLRSAPDSPALLRFREVARIVTGNPASSAHEGIEWVKDLCTELQLPSLKEFGLNSAEFSLVVEKAQRASSMKGNPVELSGDELLAILHQAV